MTKEKDVFSPFIYLSREDYELISNSSIISVNDGVISTEIIKRILNDDEYFEKVKNYFNNVIDRFILIYKKDNHIVKIFTLKKMDIIEGIHKYFNNGYEVSEKEQERYCELEKLVSFNRFKENTHDEIYNCIIDGDEYSVSISDMINVLNSDNFIELLENDQIKDILGMKKQYFVYLVRQYFVTKNVFQNYIMSIRLKNNYSKMLEIFDIESINKYVITEDKLHREVMVNKELEDEILSNIPDYFNDLEKAIYIYIRMCQLFSYDEHVYVFNQRGKEMIKHQNISHIREINLENRELVCFEFNMIYCYFLNKLGIHFKSNYLRSCGENYGSCHVNVGFRYEEFLIQADSLESIIFSDMYLAKVNQLLKGIKCLNTNSKTQGKFREILKKVTEYIYTEEEIMDDVSQLSVVDKLRYIYEKISNKKMHNMDRVSYFVDLFNHVFTKEERNNKVKMSLVRNNGNVNIVITINMYHLDCISQNVYYVILPDSSMVPVSHKKLQELFDNKLFEYINIERGEIPGIVLSDEAKTLIKRI